MSNLIPKNVFYTPQEIADMELRGLPNDKSHLNKFAKRENWQSKGEDLARPRSGKGGGWEYNPSVFPEVAQNDFIVRQFKNVLNENSEYLQETTAKKAAEKEIIYIDNSRILDSKEVIERDAKLDILRCWEIFRNQHKGLKSRADKAFIFMYNSGQSNFECIQHACIKSISKPSLNRWLKDRNSYKIGNLASRGGGRKGTGFFENALGGKIKIQIGAHYLNKPQISMQQMLEAITLQFGSEIEFNGKMVKMPHKRTLTRFFNGFMAEYENAFMMELDPDGYKNHIKLVGNNMNAHVVRFNQKWEVDASPTDILTTDGRYTLYALIDVFSRRLIIYISKTPKTEAVLALTRMAILLWGIPEEISTDNGSDFVSLRYITALKDLNIVHHRCTAYSPEQKGTVERVIKTINHELMSMIPGFIGHSVADRKKIEARKSFANRLGTKNEKLFCIETTPEKLQEYCTQWAEFKYGRREHGGIGMNGMSPFGKQDTCTKELKKIKDIAALDLLFAPTAGVRTFTKHGVRIDKEFYWSSEVEVHSRVYVVHSPDDLGIIYLFDEDKKRFISMAECPALSKVNPRAMIKAKQKDQKEQHRRALADIKSQARKAKPSDLVEGIMAEAVKEANNVTRLPKREVDYTTDALDAAGDALGGYKTVEKHKVEVEIVQHPKVVVVEPEHIQRANAYIKCNKILANIKAGNDVLSADKRWADGYVKNANYISEKIMEEAIKAANDS
ncbi:MAG: transposase [Rhizobiales bacterium]|nr:transposase [Hyphomicrobiales bacterium]